MINFPNINKQATVEIRDGALLMKHKRNEATLKKTMTHEKYIQGRKEYGEYLEELQLVRLKMEEKTMITIQNEFIWRAKSVEAIAKAIAAARVHGEDITGISFNLGFANNPDVIRYASKELFTAPMRFAVIGYDTAKYANAKNEDPKDPKVIEKMMRNINDVFCTFVDEATAAATWGSIYIAGNEEYGHIWVEFDHSPHFIDTAAEYGYHAFKMPE